MLSFLCRHIFYVPCHVFYLMVVPVKFTVLVQVTDWKDSSPR